MQSHDFYHDRRNFLSHYTVGAFHPNDTYDMVEADAINAYVMNMISTAADWYKGQSNTNSKMITHLDTFKSVIVNKFFGSVTPYHVTNINKL